MHAGPEVIRNLHNRSVGSILRFDLSSNDVGNPSEGEAAGGKKFVA